MGTEILGTLTDYIPQRASVRLQITSERGIYTHIIPIRLNDPNRERLETACKESRLIYLVEDENGANYKILAKNVALDILSEV